MDMVSLLLQHGAKVNARDSEGGVALHTAAALGKTRIARKLILAGGDVNVRDVRGNTPLHVSAGSGHLGVVRLLLDNGPDLHAANKEGLTPAGCAKMFDHKKVEQYLEERRNLQA